MKTRKRCSLLAPEREDSSPYGPYCMAFCLGVGNWLAQERHACAHLLLYAPLWRAGRMHVNPGATEQLTPMRNARVLEGQYVLALLDAGPSTMVVRKNASGCDVPRQIRTPLLACSQLHA